MATEIHYFTGKAKWAKVHEPDEKYNNYQICLYMDEDSRARYDKSGLRLKDREDEDGEYIQFRRNHEGYYKGEEAHVFGPPTVLNEDGETITDLVGNGSDVTVKVEIYDTKMGRGHRMEAVRVNELVEYNGAPTVVAAEDEVPF